LNGEEIKYPKNEKVKPTAIAYLAGYNLRQLTPLHKSPVFGMHLQSRLSSIGNFFFPWG
jgi:hypothetical protein